MNNQSAKPKTSSHSWGSFKLSTGTSKDVRRSAATIQGRVESERKVFLDASLVNGGTKTK